MAGLIIGLMRQIWYKARRGNVKQGERKRLHLKSAHTSSQVAGAFGLQSGMCGSLTHTIWRHHGSSQHA